MPIFSKKHPSHLDFLVDAKVRCNQTAFVQHAFSKANLNRVYAFNDLTKRKDIALPNIGGRVVDVEIDHETTKGSYGVTAYTVINKIAAGEILLIDYSIEYWKINVMKINPKFFDKLGRRFNENFWVPRVYYFETDKNSAMKMPKAALIRTLLGAELAWLEVNNALNTNEQKDAEVITHTTEKYVIDQSYLCRALQRNEAFNFDLTTIPHAETPSARDAKELARFEARHTELEKNILRKLINLRSNYCLAILNY